MSVIDCEEKDCTHWGKDFETCDACRYNRWHKTLTSQEEWLKLPNHYATEPSPAGGQHQPKGNTMTTAEIPGSDT